MFVNQVPQQNPIFNGINDESLKVYWNLKNNYESLPVYTSQLPINLYDNSFTSSYMYTGNVKY